MISIIICSRKSNISEELKQNIQATIGIEYELVIIDNSKNQYSIFQAYNEGVRRAKYPYLCFMHDDILYHTQDWGEKVITHFQNEKVGVIGVAGGHYMPNTPASWASTKCVSLNLIQSSNSRNSISAGHFTKLEYSNGQAAEVIVIDGFWFCCKKKIFEKISFDEITFSSFHYYDADICFQARKVGFRIYVVPNILIEHFSWGTWDKVFYESAYLFYDKWKEGLPQIVGIDLSQEEIILRNEFAKEVFSLTHELANFQSQLIEIRQSKAYLLGKLILKPFSFFRHNILRK